MATQRVIIPDELFGVLEWDEEGLPAICAVNQAIANFEPKAVFAWHLSIIVELSEVAGNGMPTAEENGVVDALGTLLNAKIKADGNALFLARTTWNRTRQILYRVHDPRMAHAGLTEIIEQEGPARPFEFKMDHDPKWALAEYFLESWRT